MNANQLKMFLLFLCLTTGFPLSAQQSEAERKLLAEIRAKAEKGDAQAQFELGATFQLGNLGVLRDDVEAVKWYRKAAEQGHAEAQCDLGTCYYQGRGVLQNYAEAADWYRKAGSQGLAAAQWGLGSCYFRGYGVTWDYSEAITWYRKAAEQGYAEAYTSLAICYSKGFGVPQDQAEAIKLHRKATEQYRKAAEQGDLMAQYNLGFMYDKGEGVAKDLTQSVKWYRKAAEQGYAMAQCNLGACYAAGNGVLKDYVEAYKWRLLAASQGNELSKDAASALEGLMTAGQIAEGQKLAREFKPRKALNPGDSVTDRDIVGSDARASGSGFFISDDGYLVSNCHVVEGTTQVRVVTSAGLMSAKVVKVDAANDLALLKAEGRFQSLPVASSRSVKLGATVATVGFPNIGLQGFAPKLAKGEVGSLTGAQDDPRYFQISVPVQPGNSGGALVDQRGNVVGVVSAKLSARAALQTSGTLPENVNYAVKSSFLGFLESVPEIAAKLKDPNTKDRKFEDVVKSAELAAVLVLVY